MVAMRPATAYRISGLLMAGVSGGIGRPCQAAPRPAACHAKGSPAPARFTPCQAASVIVTTHLPLIGPPKFIHTAHRLVAPAELVGIR